MATRKIVTETVEDEPQEGEFTEVFDDDSIAEAQLDALDGMIAEFSGAADTVVNVYRQGEGKNLSFLFRTNPDEMTGGEIMERCRDNYGTGDYRVHIRKGSRLVKNAPFSVEAKLAPEEKPHNNGLDMTAVLAMMQENNNRTMQMFSEAMRAFAERGNSAPAFDPVAAQASLMQQLVALKGLSEPKDNSKGAIEMFIQGISLAKDLGPREGETNTSDILLKALETFGGPLVDAANKMRQMPSPGNGANPGNADPQATADAQREREMGIRNMMLKQQLGFLVANAAAGKNPELYAELLLDQLGEETVLNFIGQPDAMEKLIAINPDVAKHKPWFDALRRALLELTARTGETDHNAPPFTMQGNVIIPGVDPPDAVSDADNDGNATGTSTGASGDAADA